MAVDEISLSDERAARFQMVLALATGSTVAMRHVLATYAGTGFAQAPDFASFAEHAGEAFEHERRHGGGSFLKIDDPLVCELRHLDIIP